MDDTAAALAPEEKAAVVLRGMGAVLIEGTLLGLDFMDAPGGLQPLQLAVDGGQAHRAAGAAQVLGQVRGGEGLLGPLLQAAEDGLVLFRAV